MAIIKNNINFGNQNIKRIYKGNNQITQIWKYEGTYYAQKKKNFMEFSTSSKLGFDIESGVMVYPAEFSLVVTDTDGTVISIKNVVVTTPSNYKFSNPQINGNTITFEVYAPAPEISVTAAIKVTYTVKKNKIDFQNKLLYYYGDGSQGLTYSDISVWKATVTNLGAENPNDVVFDVPDNTVEKPWSEVTFNGDTFIRFNKMYRKILTITDNQITSFSISNKKLDDDYKLYPCFIDESGNELDYILVGKYASKSKDTCNSIATGSIEWNTMANGREKARARGAGYQIMDWRIYKLWQDLVICAYKKINITGDSDITIDALGLDWDCGPQNIDGCCNNDTVWIYSNTPSKYIDSPTISSDGYAAIFGYSAPTTGDITKKLGYDSTQPFFNYPSETIEEVVGESTDIYYCSMYNEPDQGNNLLWTVFGMTKSTNAFSLAAQSTWSLGHSVRLCYRPPAKTVSSMPKLTVTGKTSVSITHLDIPRYTFEFEDQNRIGTVMAINNQALAHTDSSKLNGGVSISNDIENIGEKAFLDCTGITSVNIGPNIKSIGLAAFACCPRLKTVYWWAENCTEAGNDIHPIFGEYPETEIASMQNTAITQVNIGSNVKSLPAYAFTKCKSLSSIAIPNSVTAVGDALLEFSGITSASTGNGLQTISPYMFNNCSNLQKVKLGSAVKIISEFAFQNCTSLEKIAFPSSVTQIQPNAFKDVIELTGSFTRNTLRIYIEDFDSWCKVDGLTHLMNPHWGEHISGSINLLQYELYQYSDFNKPEDQQKQITKISISSDVYKIPDHAFFNCIYLASVTLPSDLSSIGAQAFSGCRNLKTINIPDNVQSIGEQAFGSTLIESLTIPYGVTVIPSYMIQNCTELTSMQIPGGVKTIQAGLIYGATRLERITYAGARHEWEAIDKKIGYDSLAAGQKQVTVYCQSDGSEVTIGIY